MKEFKCPDCDEVFRSETSDEMMKILMPHYMEVHQEMMKNGTEEDKKVWFEKFNKDWEDTAEINE